MNLNMRIFIGADCDEKQLILGFIGSQGILKSLSTTASPLPDRLNMFGTYLSGMIRGLRGELNLRMKNFCGLGIGVPGRFVTDVRSAIAQEMKSFADIPFYVEDREKLAVAGSAWLKEVADMAHPGERRAELDLSVVYGAAKLAIDGTSLKGSN